MENARYIQDRFQFTHPVWGATEIESRELDVARPFQFTHPVWGATLSPLMHRLDYFRFNSRTPCGVRREIIARAGFDSKFQFTHPVWGATSHFCARRLFQAMFQFTHPVWGATSALGYQEIEGRVSIHAPRVGCDFTSLYLLITESSFNSRTPCGVRPLQLGRMGVIQCFNSRTPCGVRP